MLLLMLYLEIVLIGFRIRFHYGHPDVFDRIFHITRGGMSKASRGINLSEDIFAGRILKAYILLFLYLAKKMLQNLFSLEQMQFHSLPTHMVLCRFQLNTKTRECYSS